MVRKASAWTKFLTNFHNKNNKGKSLGLSMKPAAKLWKTVKNRVSRGGDVTSVPAKTETAETDVAVLAKTEPTTTETAETETDVAVPADKTETPAVVGGKRRRGKKTAKKSSSRRKRKTSKK